MNCKPGDLAVVVKGAASGNVVVCIDRFDGPWAGEPRFEPGWRLDRLLVNERGSYNTYRVDSALRPIRDQPGEDETLTWADVPKQLETT